MGLLKQSQNQYYSGVKSFTGDGTVTVFTVAQKYGQFPTTFDASDTKIHIDGVLFAADVFTSAGTATTTGTTTNNYTFEYNSVNGWHVTFATAPALGVVIKVSVDTKKYQIGNGAVKDIVPYQFTTLFDVINNFVVAYTGEDKILMKANRTDIQFHAMRALQELSFDTFKSTKSQEIEVPPSLKMILPHDYVNYVKLSSKDANGIERVLYPAIKSSDPFAIKQKADGSYDFDIDNSANGIDESDDLISPDNSDTWTAFKSNTPAANATHASDNYNSQYEVNNARYGMDPSTAQINGGFYINDTEGYVHFSSAMAGTTIILKYISDSLGTDEEMVVHKFAEEALYKHIMYGMLSTRLNIPENVIQRYKRERFAETRKAKLRLSNIKIEEITQILRGKSKFIKH